MLQCSHKGTSPYRSREFIIHILHFIAVEADSAEEAVSTVDTALDSNIFDWSDWAVVGGRWEDRFGKVISYKEDPTKFHEALGRARDNRKKEVNSLLAEADIEDILDELRNYDGNREIGWQSYRLSQALRIASGQGQWDNYFYDLANYSSGDEMTLKRIESDPDRQYLVAVDFHF